MRRILLFALLIATNGVAALDYKPYPEAKITVDEFESYRQEVLTNFRDTEERYETQNLVTYSDFDNRMHFAFTLPGHEAHPAWITRRVTEKGGAVYISQIGYFAGSEKAFAKLFAAYQELEAKIREQLRNQAE